MQHSLYRAGKYAFYSNYKSLSQEMGTSPQSRFCFATRPRPILRYGGLLGERPSIGTAQEADKTRTNQMDDIGSITEIAHRLTYPNSRPRDAASLILVDRGADEPKVLLGRRNLAHAFMPGHFVFPGGRVEAADRDVAACAGLHRSVEARLLSAVATSKAKSARGFALAAIRETFEETGIVVGRKPSAVAPPARGISSGPWADFFATGFLPDLSGLRFIARAITPPRARRRFDARFLAVDAGAIAYQATGVVHPDAELTEIVWVGLPEAIKLPLPDITQVVLGDLAESIAAGFAQDAPVPFYRMERGRYARRLLQDTAK